MVKYLLAEHCENPFERRLILKTGTPPPYQPLPGDASTQEEADELARKTNRPKNYDPEEVYDFASYKGRTHTVSAKVPEWMHTEIESLILTQRKNYRTVSDFLRDATYKLLRHFEEGGVVRRSWDVIALETAELAARRMENLKAALGSTKQVLDTYADSKDWNALQNYVADMSFIWEFPEPWQSRFKELLESSIHAIPREHRNKDLWIWIPGAWS